MDEVSAPPPPPPSPAGPEFLRRPGTTLLLLGVTVPTDLLHMYLSTYRRIEPVAVGFILIAWVVGNLIMVLPWSALWALVSRLVRRESHFLGHLNTVLSAQFCWTLTRDALGFAAFAGSLDAWILWPWYAAAWVGLTLVLGTHLRFVLESTPRRAYAWGGVAAGGLVGLLATVSVLALHRTPGARFAQVSLLPGALRFRAARPIADHVAVLSRLQETADSLASAP